MITRVRSKLVNLKRSEWLATECPEIYQSAFSIRTKLAWCWKSRFLSVDLKISFPNLLSQKWSKNTYILYPYFLISAVYDRYSSLITEVPSRSRWNAQQTQKFKCKVSALAEVSSFVIILHIVLEKVVCVFMKHWINPMLFIHDIEWRSELHMQFH